jgi:hypothetical protein
VPNIHCEIEKLCLSTATIATADIFYDHCSVLQITPDPAKAIDKNWPAAQ